MFTEYAATPHQIAKHVPPMPTLWQLNDLRVVSVKGHEDDPVSMTTAADIAGVVRLAIEYEGEWPEVGGICGQKITPREIQRATEKVRGKS